MMRRYRPIETVACAGNGGDNVPGCALNTGVPAGVTALTVFT